MPLNRVITISHKEFLHVWRDPRSLALSLAIPFILLALFGWALSLDVNHVPLAVLDRAQNAQSRDLVARFVGSPYFDVRYAESQVALDQVVETGAVKASLLIPPEMGVRPNGVALQLLVDGSDPAVGAIVLGYADAVVSQFAAERRLQQVVLRGQAPPAPALSLRGRVWYNPELVTRNAIIPALIATLLSVVAALMTALTVAREWETGTMESLLSTPVTGPELIVGKLIPYFTIGMLDTAIAVATALAIFHVPLNGSVWLLFGATALFLGATLGLGILVSVVTKSQLLASQLAFILTLLPAFLLSGLVFAVADMPPPLQVLSGVFPASYFVTVLRAIHLKGLGPIELAAPLLTLAAFACFFLVVAGRAFKKKLA